MFSSSSLYSPPTGDVTSISLSDSNLVGTIPPELGLLTKLKTLNISNNIIMGDSKFICEAKLAQSVVLWEIYHHFLML